MAADKAVLVHKVGYAIDFVNQPLNVLQDLMQKLGKLTESKEKINKNWNSIPMYYSKLVIRKTGETIIDTI